MDVAANAAQARASRARQVPDLVLLDIWMPDMDGITLLREWSTGAADGCPVVMMSGHGTVETAVEATRLGAFDFVEKPLSLAKLLRTVERALDAGRRHRQSGKLLASALQCADRQEPHHAAAALRAAADGRQPLAAALDRRAGLGARGLRALRARAQPARRRALRHAHRGHAARGGCGGAPVRSRGGRRGAPRGPARAGRWRHALPPRGRGSAGDRAAPALRRARVGAATRAWGAPSRSLCARASFRPRNRASSSARGARPCGATCWRT